MGRRTQIAGDTAVAAGAAMAGVMIASALVTRWSLWWLMAPLSALYHLAALICMLSGQPLVVVVVLLAEAVWTIVAARVGRRDGTKAHDAGLAQDLVAEDPSIDAVRRLQALSALEPLTRPAQGHELALAFCWFAAPIQTAAYRSAFVQARDAIAMEEAGEVQGAGRTPTTAVFGVTATQRGTSPAAPGVGAVRPATAPPLAGATFLDGYPLTLSEEETAWLSWPVR